MTLEKPTESCWVRGLRNLRILVDTNILLDLVAKDRPAHRQAVKALRGALCASCELLAVTSSLKDVYCLYGRHYGDEAAAREAISFLEDIVDLRSLEPRHIRRALVSPEPDFEDGIVRVIAEDESCAYILTRDAKGFIGSKAQKIEPDELFALVSEQQ